MNGCVISGTSIAVDFWQVQKRPGISLFFLTHLHGDHVVGLTSSWRRPVYCSPLTAQLLMERYGVSQCILRPLEVDQTHLVPYCHGSRRQPHIKDISSGAAEQSTAEKNEPRNRSCDFVSVTVISANHCPGAVMFVFEGSFGKILHTGDFRYCPSMFDQDCLLSKHIATVDVLYLDNTYCSPKCVFPSREKALEEIVHITQRHHDHDIVFGIRGLGKEELLASVAIALGEWINVPPRVLSVVTSLGFPNVFKSGQPDLRVRVVPFQNISCMYVRQLNSKKPTIVILPTALYQGIYGRPYVNQPEVFVVPYSDHSSFPELIQFVSKLKPSRIVPIVRGKVRGPFGVDISNREDMTCFQPYLSKPRTSRCIAPDTTSAEKPCPLILPTQTFSAGPYSLASKTNGFEDLFPDFQQPPLKRKQSMKKRPRRKVLLPKGVNYVSDEEDSGGGEKEQVLVRRLQGTTENSNDATEQKEDAVEYTSNTKMYTVTAAGNQEIMDIREHDDSCRVDDIANTMSRQTSEQNKGEDEISFCFSEKYHCTSPGPHGMTSNEQFVDHSSSGDSDSDSLLISSKSKNAGSFSCRRFCSSGEAKRLMADSLPHNKTPSLVQTELSANDQFAMLLDSETSLPDNEETRTRRTKSTEDFVHENRTTVTEKSKSRQSTLPHVQRHCLSARVREYLTRRFESLETQSAAQRRARLIQTYTALCGRPGRRKNMGLTYPEKN